MVIVVLFSVMFLYLNVNNRTDVSFGSTNQRLRLPEITDEGETAGKAPAEYCVIFSGGEKTEEKIYENVCRFLDQMKLPYRTAAYVTEAELEAGIKLIFCNTKISEGMALEVLLRYMEQGGKALFAAGIPESYTDAFLSPLWGILEKGSRMESTRWLIYDGFMPAEEMSVTSPDFEASTRVKLDDKAVIYMVDEEKGIPVVYGYGYGEGYGIMINSTLMQNRYAGGVFAASIAALQGELLYPVIGTATVFLEDFPFILSGYDKNCVTWYGRNTENFERDILWPVLVSYCVGYGLKYTMNLYEQPEDIGAERLNERLLTYLMKENMRYSGETMISVCGDNDSREVRELFGKHFPDYEIQAYSRRILQEGKAERSMVGTGEEDIPIIRGSYAGDGMEAAGQDFGQDGRKVDFPVMSSGFSFEDAAYRYLAGLSLYGVVSHSLPMAQLITAASRDESYEGVKSDMGTLLEKTGAAAKWLSAATVTEAAGRTAAVGRLRAETIYKAGEVRTVCSNFSEGQKFFFHTDGEIEKIMGGTAKKMGKGWYCIDTAGPEFTIGIKE